VWSIQSVGDLLDAVNRETLGRIEGYEKRIEERLKVWEQFQLNNIQGGVDAIHSTNTNIVVPDIQAIKRRVGA
jgi:hypothetical protein